MTFTGNRIDLVGKTSPGVGSLRILIDGKGNAFKPFTSTSGQIMIDPDLWRRAERNRTGDRFTFEVHRCVLDEISFKGEADQRFVTRLAQVLPNREHTLELVPTQPGEVSIERLDVFEPPIRSK